MLPERLNSGGRDFKNQLSAEVVAAVLNVAKLARDADAEGFFQLGFICDGFEHGIVPRANDVVLVRQHSGILE
jgi:hypothetical protein